MVVLKMSPPGEAGLKLSRKIRLIHASFLQGTTGSNGLIRCYILVSFRRNLSWLKMVQEREMTKMWKKQVKYVLKCFAYNFKRTMCKSVPSWLVFENIKNVVRNTKSWNYKNVSVKQVQCYKEVSFSCRTKIWQCGTDKKDTEFHERKLENDRMFVSAEFRSQ